MWMICGTWICLGMAVSYIEITNGQNRCDVILWYMLQCTLTMCYGNDSYVIGDVLN